MADFVAHAPPFDTWTEPKRTQVIAGLVAAINRHAYTGMVTAVFKEDYDMFVTGKLRDMLGCHHYTFAVESCLAYIEQWRLLHHDKQAYAYVFDWMGRGKNEINNLFEDILAKNLGDRFGIEPRGWTFADRRSVLPLQASDILAWEAYKYIGEYQSAGRKPRESFQSMVNHIKIFTRLFDTGSLYEFAQQQTRKYEAINWQGPHGAFFE